MVHAPVLHTRHIYHVFILPGLQQEIQTVPHRTGHETDQPLPIVEYGTRVKVTRCSNTDAAHPFDSGAGRTQLSTLYRAQYFESADKPPLSVTTSVRSWNDFPRRHMQLKKRA